MDPCKLPKNVGKCSDTSAESYNPITRFFFDNEQKKCQAFTFEGCGNGNQNNFITKHECQVLCETGQEDQDVICFLDFLCIFSSGA